jgi:NADH dehydrogenase [ubiquinone] 1 alpha subcomplex assembly factor 7
MQVHWHDDMRNIPEHNAPMLVVAHEFFDALPVHQFVKDPDRGWLEKMVDVDDEGGGLRMVLSPSMSIP